MYLSFDVGIKNLAYCLYDNESDTIIEWGIIDLSEDTLCVKKNISISKISSIMMRTFKDKFKNVNITYVLIENQPVMKNPLMKSIQMLLFSYFSYIKNIEDSCIEDIVFVSAVKKNKYMDKYVKEKELEIDIDKQKNKYRYYKKTSIRCVENILCEMENASDKLCEFQSHKKKDDLADAFLQCKAYLT